VLGGIECGVEVVEAAGTVRLVVAESLYATEDADLTTATVDALLPQLAMLSAVRTAITDSARLLLYAVLAQCTAATGDARLLYLTVFAVLTATTLFAMMLLPAVRAGELRVKPHPRHALKDVPREFLAAVFFGCRRRIVRLGWDFLLSHCSNRQEVKSRAERRG
jgi:hypothetical protein